MKYLFLNSAKSWGGNEQWTYLAANSLAEQDNVCLAYRTDKVGQRFRVPSYRMPFLSELDPITLFQLRRLIKSHNIDVLIPTKRKDYVLAGLAARSKGIKNVLRLGIVRHLKESRINRLVYDTLCDGIIVNADSIRRELLRSSFVRPEKIRVIRNGIEIESIQEKAARKNGFVKPFEFLISSMGELSGRKGFDFLLKGFASFLRQTGTSAKCGLILIGSGPAEDTIRDLARDLNIDSNVVLVGFQENPYPLLSASDLFVLTSRREGIPNAILEAMALKLPVVMTNIDGAAEVIQDGVNGYLIDRENTQDLAALIDRQFRDAGKRKLVGEAGSRTVFGEFSIERMSREIDDFCRTV
jgi:glycosyltransferase involved in cell wall biosynthesis